MDIDQSQPRRNPYPLVELTEKENAKLQKALLSVRSLPRSLSLVPAVGALEVWVRRRIPGGSRWVLVRRIPSPISPGMAPQPEPDEVLTDFIPL